MARSWHRTYVRAGQIGRCPSLTPGQALAAADLVSWARQIDPAIDDDTWVILLRPARYPLGRVKAMALTEEDVSEETYLPLP